MFPQEPHAAAFFDWISKWSQWFTWLPLTEAVFRLRDGSLPNGAACITFDDGYVDNFEVAAPILKKMGVPATFFVATDFMDGGYMFNDRVVEACRLFRGVSLDLRELGYSHWSMRSGAERALAVDEILKEVKYLPYEKREAITKEIVTRAGVSLSVQPMMNTKQVEALARMGFEIGAHTLSHPILLEVADELARKEIGESRVRLQELTGQPISMFAYPNGKPDEDYDLRHVTMVENAGFLGAVATIPGAARHGDDPYQIPRFTPWHGASWKSGVQFLRNYYQPIAALKPRQLF